MVDTYFQLPPDSTGKKLKARSQAQGSDTVHIQFVDQDEERTYIVWSLATAVANLKSLLSLNNTSSTEIIEVQEIFVVPANASGTITGVIHDIRLFRYATDTLGTSLTIKPMDLNDAVPAGINAKTGATVVGEESTPLDRWYISGDEFVIGTVDSDWHDLWMSTFFPRWAMTQRKAKSIVLRQNQGITIKETTNTAVGVFDVGVLFTLRNL